MSKDLIFEIGTEEIPAGFVPKALGSLEGFLKKALDSRKISYEAVVPVGTPRRLALMATGVAERQPDAKVEVRGPQVKAAFDEKGNPSGALIGFAKAQGVAIEDLKRVKTDKGEYLYATKEINGEDTEKILPGMLLDVVSRDFFAKAMRWGAYDISFARPIHWILAVFGGRTVDFSFGHIKAGSSTYGHRFLSNRTIPIEVDSVDSYIKRLRDAYVIVDPAERRSIIEKGLHHEAGKADGAILPDEGLVEEVTYLVEYPVVLRGSFSEEFLTLPRDVIVNAMREHQRYFSIVNRNGALLPYFLTVANTKAVDMDVVRKGNERVLRARLNDAKFYYEQDIKKRLVERVAALKGVVFQAKLGTSYEKVERFTSLALVIGARLGFSRAVEPGEKPADFATDALNPASLDRQNADPGLYAKCVLGRAALLAKADLTSGMVGEFPKLQGVMGSIYAKRGGEVDEVATAIYEHYLPSASGGALPASVPGAIVSIADKLDTITGCFGVGLIPTGAQDPYALRRQALGIIAIILDKSFRVQLDSLVDASLDNLGKKLLKGREETREAVLEFFKERLKNQLLSQDLPFDSIDAVLSAPWFDMVDAVKRVRSLEGFKKNPACASLVVASKRVLNILKGVSITDKVDESLFSFPEEAGLYKTENEIAPRIEEYWKKGDYEAVFSTLASIKGDIDAFFDKVMVMAEDERVRKNRLSLLSKLRDLYWRIADLSRLAV
ncbi:MAG: glycine--tRNA ligase subunit beta [Deltaproteobacteria bacterium]|nr:glycine--tRNA ligase subunit beta [Deltaproteobacteria bacterium]